MDSSLAMDKPIPLSSVEKSSKVAASSIAVEKQVINVTQTIPEKDHMSSGNVENEKLEADLREIERLVGLDQVLEARTVVDKIQQILNSSSNNKNHPLISKERLEVIKTVIDESNNARELLYDMDNDVGWTLVSTKKNIIIHCRNDPESPLQPVKTQTVFENFTSKDFTRLVALLNEAEFLPDFFPRNVIKKSTILAEPAKYSKVIRFSLSLGGPFATRDAVAFGKGFHLPHRNAALIVSNSIYESKYCDIPPPPKGCVRFDTRAAFYIQLLPNDQVLFRSISHDDLKLKYVPSAILNYINKGGMPYEFISNIRKHIDNFEGSVWDKRMKEKKEYYEEIEDRVVAELITMKKGRKRTEPTEMIKDDSLHEGYQSQVSSAAAKTESKQTNISTIQIFWALLGIVVFLIFAKDQLWHKDNNADMRHNRSSSDYFLLPFLVLLGCAVPVTLKADSRYPTKNSNHQLKYSSTKTANTSATSLSSVSQMELQTINESEYADADDADHGATDIRGRIEKENRPVMRKKTRARKVVSNVGRTVGRVIPIRKIKRKSHKKDSIKKDTKEEDPILAQ